MSAATTLSFLSADGAITVSFEPQLTPAQYAQLFELVREGEHLSDDLCKQIKQLAEQWNVHFTTGDC